MIFSSLLFISFYVFLSSFLAFIGFLFWARMPSDANCFFFFYEVEVGHEQVVCAHQSNHKKSLDTFYAPTCRDIPPFWVDLWIMLLKAPSKKERNTKGGRNEVNFLFLGLGWVSHFLLFIPTLILLKQLG